MNPLARAQTLAQLAAAAQGSSELSRKLSEVLNELSLTPDALARMRWLARLQASSVGDFLLRRDLHQLLEPSGQLGNIFSAFQRWLLHDDTPPPPPALPPPQLEPLDELIDACAIPDLSAWKAGMLSPVIPYDLAEKPLSVLVHAPLALAKERVLANALKALARKAQALRAAPKSELALIGQEPLDGFRRGLAALRAPMLAGWPPGLIHGLLRLEANKDDLILDLSLAGDLRPLQRWNSGSQYGRWDLRDGGELHEIDSDRDDFAGDNFNDEARDEASAHKARRVSALEPAPPEGKLAISALHAWRQSLKLHCWCGRAACLHRAMALDLLLADTGKAQHSPAKLVARLLKPAWQRTLDELAAPLDKEKKDAPGTLSFVIESRGAVALFHAEGKRGPAKRGVSVRDGMTRYLPRLRGHDRKIGEAWALAGRDGYYGHDSNPFYGDALLLLEGHPAVRLDEDGPTVPVRVERASVNVVETANGVELSVVAARQSLERLEEAHGFRSSAGQVLLRPSHDELCVVLVPPEVQRLLKTLVANGKSFPREALPGLVNLLPRLEAVTRVELPDELKGEEHPSANKPVLRIEPAGAGLLLALRMEPLPAGPLFVPGQGGDLSASFDGTQRRFARRDFARELEEAAAVCAELGLDAGAASDPFTWLLERGDRGIELLRRVHHLSERGLAVEWIAPKARFSTAAKLSRVSLRIEKKRDWFGLDGEVKLDDRRVGLAALLEAARARRRWVQLGPNDYAELSDELLDGLSPLAHIAGPDKLPTLTLGTVPLVEALTHQVESVEAVEGWHKLSARLAEAKDKPIPLPEGLGTELRDYQIDGYRWMSRLAEWGAGACLADDMGLGKTVQALALLLSRASLGPALVVAPASVQHSWRAEAAQFAPALRLHLFHEGERTLAPFGPNDVVVVSWSLLAREAALFAGRRFSTAVLDEVQAIKNSGTQRAKAAHGLIADFIVALTGTPVENHIGELWSLFRAAMPSLLGSEESFRMRFASAAPDANKALAALIQPFILRRKKSEVARELPARTEMDVLVPLSPEERALYDDVRLAAAGDLGSLTGEAQRFQVLAALTRLRLTACHPKLQEPDWKGPASKLTRLLDLARDLADGGHRALVFSQFTKHLALVSEALRAEGISFSYLDGSVPLAERQRRVEQFQAGQGGNLFLISLKAGGTGLTLTAADYVIHLDPWWNPAVEDQASDRAHRIGQTRPVTVYRLIAEGTIEQQILKLHREKRELVDALLEGTDRAGKLSAEELARLIRAG